MCVFFLTEPEPFKEKCWWDSWCINELSARKNVLTFLTPTTTTARFHPNFENAATDSVALEKTCWLSFPWALEEPNLYDRISVQSPLKVIPLKCNTYLEVQQKLFPNSVYLKVGQTIDMWNMWYIKTSLFETCDVSKHDYLKHKTDQNIIIWNIRWIKTLKVDLLGSA